jgi:hypothetical protein
MTRSGLPADFEPWFDETDKWIRRQVHSPHRTLSDFQIHSEVLAFDREFRALRSRWIDFNMKVLGAP